MGRKKLSKEAFQHVRESYADIDNKLNIAQLARLFKVSPGLIDRIISDKNYNSDWSEKGDITEKKNIIESVTFTEKYRCFKKGMSIEFMEGINLLVGDQGSGKSSLLDVIINNKKYVAKLKGNTLFMALDLEKDNMRTKQANPFSQSSYNLSIHSHFMSHGESNNLLLSEIERIKNKTIILDEPDSALSPRSCYKLLKMFNKAVKNGCQLICSVHNPILITSQENVFSLESNKWVDSHKFMEGQKVK